MPLLPNIDAKLARIKELFALAPKAKQTDALKKLDDCIKKLELKPKEALAAHPVAIEIRIIWDRNRKLIDLKQLAGELGLTKAKPTVDDILLGFFQPKDRLNELKKRLQEQADSDPAAAQKKMFIDWSGRLRNLPSEEAIGKEVEKLVESSGLPTVRAFAADLNVKDPATNKKLAKTAKQPKLVAALAACLWSEKMTSKALEGS